MFYASAVVAVFQMVEVCTNQVRYYGYGELIVFLFVQGLNELRRVTTRLCGEVPLQGYLEWKELYDRSHTAPVNVGVMV